MTASSHPPYAPEQGFPWGVWPCTIRPMIPKPIQFLVLLPVAIGGMFPRLGLAVFAVGLLALAVWWLRLVFAVLFGD